jgi:predicted nucleotidyltransferase
MTLTIPPNRPLSPSVVALLQAVRQAADAVGIRVTVVGATARDLSMQFVHGLAVERATADVDVAIAVPTWTKFLELCERLLLDRRFERVPETPNRLRFRAGKNSSLPLDIIPYGQGVDKPIFIWPNDRDTKMNIAGYEEAAEDADEITISDGLVLNVASLPGLTLMKLYAWDDRRKDNNLKDASDLALMLSKYVDAGHRDRIFGNDIILLEDMEFDLDRAAPYLLGVDVSRILSERSRADVMSLIGDENRWSLLARHMSRFWPNDESAVVRAERLLEDFAAGVVRSG